MTFLAHSSNICLLPRLASHLSIGDNFHSWKKVEKSHISAYNVNIEIIPTLSRKYSIVENLKGYCI